MRITLFLIFACLGIINAQIVSSRVLNDLKNGKQVNVILELKSKADLSVINPELTKSEKAQLAYRSLKDIAIKSQLKVIRLLQQLKVNYHPFYLINGISTRINSEQLKSILNLEEIKAIHFDESLSIEREIDASVQNLKARGPSITWGIERIEADKVWNLGYEGQGVVVAGEDTGYKWDLEGIKEKYRGYSTNNIDHNYNWHDAIHSASPLSADSINPCGYSLIVPCDDSNHGTHTMGTMVGGTTTDAYGIAPKAKWIGCRNMERGNGALSTYIECFEFFLAPTDLYGLNPKPELSPSVINNSWYCSNEEGCDTSNFAIMEEVVNNLRQSGIVVVVSAGNSGQTCGNIAFPPAIFKSSFVVGAFAPNDTISSFSSSGPVYNYKNIIVKPDVVAPGSDVVSRITSGELVAWNGTSMAGPHVAGLVALIISANPALNGKVEKIENIIKLSARRAETDLVCAPFNNTDFPNYVYGYGKVLATEAIKLALITKLYNNERPINRFTIQTNWVSDYLQIIINDPNQKYRFSILNVLGQKVQDLNSETTLINVSKIPIGTYLLIDQNTMESIKFIKM